LSGGRVLSFALGHVGRVVAPGLGEEVARKVRVRAETASRNGSSGWHSRPQQVQGYRNSRIALRDGRGLVRRRVREAAPVLLSDGRVVELETRSNVDGAGEQVCVEFKDLGAVQVRRLHAEKRRSAGENQRRDEKWWPRVDNGRKRKKTTFRLPSEADRAPLFREPSTRSTSWTESGECQARMRVRTGR
jgi:hypothetical protein